jgi:hypothetical protein
MFQGLRGEVGNVVIRRAIFAQFALRTRKRMLDTCLSLASKAARVRLSMTDASLARSSASNARFSIFASWSRRLRVSFLL